MKAFYFPTLLEFEVERIRQYGKDSDWKHGMEPEDIGSRDDFLVQLERFKSKYFKSFKSNYFKSFKEPKSDIIQYLDMRNTRFSRNYVDYMINKFMTTMIVPYATEEESSED